MTTPFLVIAAIMVVTALACVLVPLLRSARREGRPRAPFVLALALALVTRVEARNGETVRVWYALVGEDGLARIVTPVFVDPAQERLHA